MYCTAMRSWLSETSAMQCRLMSRMPLSRRKGMARSAGVLLRLSQYIVLLAQKTLMLPSGTCGPYCSVSFAVTRALRFAMRYLWRL